MPTLRLEHHRLSTVPPHRSPWVSGGWWGGKGPYSQKAWSLVSSICGQKQKAIKILPEAHRGWPTCPVRYHSGRMSAQVILGSIPGVRAGLVPSSLRLRCILLLHLFGGRAPSSSLQIFDKSTNPASYCQGTRSETYFSTDLNCDNGKQTACRI